MRSDTQLVVRKLLTNDLLLSIFDKLSVIHKKRLSRVCKHWQQLIKSTLLWVDIFSAVDDRRCVTDWQPSNWLGLKFVPQRNYIRIPGVSASEILSKNAHLMPNLKAIDLECCDMNSRIIRSIVESCNKVERINLDSSTRLNYYSFNLMVQDWKRLRHVNLSCCSDVHEVSARFIIQNLEKLESLNLCGTKINGQCLDQLGPEMRRLDISYCWNVQGLGLAALARARCPLLEELSVNNFDFDGSEDCLVDILNNHRNLKHLQMSIGPCVTHDYFIDRITNRGFSAIGNLKNLETLIIEKVCVLDNPILLRILTSCHKLKCLRLNLKWLNGCDDQSLGKIGTLLPDLEDLQISHPSGLTCAGIAGLVNLTKLKSLALINTSVDNDLFKYIDKLDNLVSIKLDDCRKITLRGLNHLCRIASRHPERKLIVSLLGTGIVVTRLRNRRNFPPNLIAQISNFRATKYHLQLPPVPEPATVI